MVLSTVTPPPHSTPAKRDITARWGETNHAPTCASDDDDGDSDAFPRDNETIGGSADGGTEEGRGHQRGWGARVVVIVGAITSGGSGNDHSDTFQCASSPMSTKMAMMLMMAIVSGFFLRVHFFLRTRKPTIPSSWAISHNTKPFHRTLFFPLYPSKG
ncbi:ankyrin repeat protein [Anopheles sinensis]|uniref:Ankyrin repeat protein n=1 Tax=Anopheles sinensis TaxID=74873 RepID=A0A084W562_ANOSI|nr:ankyrin repeat protein [Anopheles sinensis]